MEKDYFVHESAYIDEPVKIGKGTKIWHFCHVMSGAKIGENCVLGQNVFIGKDVQIGNNVHVQNNVSVYTKVILEDNVFCGPSMVFTNVLNPRAGIRRPLDEYLPTLVKEGATIGANATIVCGHTIGRYAFIGAGAIVTKDVPDYALVYGNAARIAGWMCECGEKIDFTRGGESGCHKPKALVSEANTTAFRGTNPIEYATCVKCQKRYEKQALMVKQVE